jgi:tRNA G18 (ribose-2'-O)-methylase SpoU
MKKLTHAEIAAHRVPLNKIESARRVPLTVMVDNVRSLYNVGSIFRTSDGAMIEKLILTGFTPYPPRKEIDKTALGATESIPWEYCKDPLLKIQELKNTGYTICCLELTDTGIPYYEFDPKGFPLCLVIGNEITGVSKEILNTSDCAVDIPMYGMKQSLNVAVAYGIAVFELTRLWRTGGVTAP